MNGQRQGASGFQGMFTDVSTIPVSAVERIEILPEGTAALYGSDAIGGVVNIILAQELRWVRSAPAREARQTAMPTSGRIGATTGSRLVAWPCTSWAFSSTTAMPCHAVHAPTAPRTLTSGASAAVTCAVSAAIPAPSSIRTPLAPIAAIPHGQDGTQLTAEQLIPGAVNYTDNVTDNDILPEQTMRSAFVSSSYRLTDNWEISARRPLFIARFQIHFSRNLRVNLTCPRPMHSITWAGTVLVAYDLTSRLGSRRRQWAD